MRSRTRRSALLNLSLAIQSLAILCALSVTTAALAESDAARLVAAMLADSPLEEDLQSLTDEIGGRPTGSEANLLSVEWALERFRDAGVAAQKEAFDMPVLWLENSAVAQIETADGEVVFSPRIAAMPYSPGTPEGQLTAPVVDAGRGTEEDFARLGEAARGAWALIETDELLDLAGLFAEYAAGAALEPRAIAAGVAGVAYVGSRGGDLLYRHNAAAGPKTDRPMLVIERDAGLRALRLLRSGRTVEMTVQLDIESGGSYTSHNVIGEIKGSLEPEEFVVIGAHLDSWGLGTGALDNGCNVSLVIDIARQIQRLGLTPKRTIRFALFNGEEQGLSGSHGYVKTHADELDRTVMASSFDIGSGRIDGFFTGGRPELAVAVDRSLAGVAAFGPFAQIDIPIVGTDNYDFMMEGVGNLVASQESANYGPNYHARSDTFDKVDLPQLRQNAAVAAAVIWAFAEMEVDWRRQSRAEIERLVAGTDLQQQMESFGLWESWLDGSRGRHP